VTDNAVLDRKRIEHVFFPSPKYDLDMIRAISNTRNRSNLSILLEGLEVRIVQTAAVELPLATRFVLVRQRPGQLHSFKHNVRSACAKACFGHNLLGCSTPGSAHLRPPALTASGRSSLSLAPPLVWRGTHIIVSTIYTACVLLGNSLEKLNPQAHL
jgi:hypothetical protein